MLVGLTGRYKGGRIHRDTNHPLPVAVVAQEKSITLHF